MEGRRRRDRVSRRLRRRRLRGRPARRLDPRLRPPAPRRAGARRPQPHRLALEQLARLREGAFSFELTEAVPTHGRHARDPPRDAVRRASTRRSCCSSWRRASTRTGAVRGRGRGLLRASREEAVVEEAPPIARRRRRGRPAPADPAAEPAARPGRTRPRSGRRAARHGAAAAVVPPAPPSRGPPAPAGRTPATRGARGRPRRGARRRPAEPTRARSCWSTTRQDVRDILGQHFADAGLHGRGGRGPRAGAEGRGRLREAGRPFVLVTDLGMPATGGASFHGGFEVVKRLWKMNLRPPVLMMTEMLSQSLRLRAKQMGVKAFVFKPDAQQAQLPAVRGRPVRLRREARAGRAAAAGRGGGPAPRRRARRAPPRRRGAGRRPARGRAGGRRAQPSSSCSGGSSSCGTAATPTRSRRS